MERVDYIVVSGYDKLWFHEMKVEYLILKAYIDGVEEGYKSWINSEIRGWLK